MLSRKTFRSRSGFAAAGSLVFVAAGSVLFVLLDQRSEIGPQVESLNVAVAAGIALYLLRPVSPPRPSAP